jgi:hypothetical protein
MYAYNMARLIPDTLPQIIMLPANEGTDHHAFVLLGVATKFAEETPISRIAQQYPGAVVIDYWAVQNGYSEYQGAFPIGVFDTETEDSLDKYDKERAKTWNYS